MKISGVIRRGLWMVGLVTATDYRAERARRERLASQLDEAREEIVELRLDDGQPEAQP